MKSLKIVIFEKLILNKNSKEKTFSDEELMHDYNEVWSATTKAEKKTIADKYGINIYKIRDIQLHILDLLRENRKNKHEFDENDIKNFFRYDIPEKYDKFLSYIEKEPKEFVEFILEKYKKLRNKINPVYQSAADKRVMKIYNNLTRYLNSI